MLNIFSPDKVEIVEVSIRSERFKSDKKLIITKPVLGQERAGVGVELEIYENIYMPYLTGRILIQDDNDIYRVAEIKGTERVIVQFASPSSGALIEKVFIISEVQRNIKVNDQLAHLLLELTEDHGYFNDLQVINKSYNGNGVEIIEKILADNTNKKLKKNYYKQPYQRDMRYIVPWQTSYQAINTILSHITTENSMPYFFFSSLTSDDLILTDLESILNRESFNTKSHPFTFSRADLNRKLSIEEQALQLSDFTATHLNDTLSLARTGGIGASFESVDTLSGQPENIRLNMKDEYKNLDNAGVINLNENRYPVDDKFRIDNNEGTEITGFNSKRYSLLSHSPYTDTNGLVPNYLVSRQIAVKDNFIKHLADNMYRITAPGLTFSVKNTNRSVGHQINLEILKDGNSELSSTNVDERKSGPFIMLAKKHIFDLVLQKHNVVINVGRITEPRRIN